MHWGNIQLLHGLWALIPMFILFRLLWNRREQRLAQLVDREALARMLPHRDAGREWRTLLRFMIAVGLIIVALARPQWGVYWQEVEHHGLDIMVVFDTSNSMRAEDMPPNRMQQAKWAVRDLVDALDGDRIGLIAFAGEAHLICPLTSDYNAFAMSLNDMYPGIVPRGGTYFRPALELALDTLTDGRRGESDAAIVLVTDGEDHYGGLESVVQRLQNKDIPVFAVGIGTPEGDLIPMRDERGREAYLRDAAGQVVKTRLGEGLLQGLASATGGLYVRARSGDFGMDYIVEEGLAPLQRGLLDERQVRMYRERFAWFLAAALLLFMVDSVPRGIFSRKKGVLQ